jgi:hypothetical protein
MPAYLPEEKVWQVVVQRELKMLRLAHLARRYLANP